MFSEERSWGYDSLIFDNWGFGRGQIPKSSKDEGLAAGLLGSHCERLPLP